MHSTNRFRTIELTDKEISAIYRKLATFCHPDKNAWSEELMKDLNNARDIALWKNWKKDANYLLDLEQAFFWKRSFSSSTNSILFTDDEIREITNGEKWFPERPKFTKEIEELLISIPNSRSILEMLDYIKKYNKLIFWNDEFSFPILLSSIEKFLWAPEWFMKFYYPNIYEVFTRLSKWNTDMLNWLYLVKHLLSWLYDLHVLEKHASFYSFERSRFVQEILDYQVPIESDLNVVDEVKSWVLSRVNWIILKFRK